MKAATAGGMDGAGHITRQDGPFALLFGVGYRDGREKGLGIGMKGCFVKGIGGGQLHQFPQIHNRNTVTNVFHHA